MRKTRNQLDDKQKSKVAELYVKHNVSVRDIAERFQASTNAVQAALARHGVALRRGPPSWGS